MDKLSSPVTGIRAVPADAVAVWFAFLLPSEMLNDGKLSTDATSGARDVAPPFDFARVNDALGPIAAEPLPPLLRVAAYARAAVYGAGRDALGAPVARDGKWLASDKSAGFVAAAGLAALLLDW